MAANAAPHGHEAHQRRSGMGAAGSTLHGVGSATSVEDGVVAAAAVARKLLAPSPCAHQNGRGGDEEPRRHRHCDFTANCRRARAAARMRAARGRCAAAQAWSARVALGERRGRLF